MIAPMNLESLKKCCDEDQWYPQSEQWKFHSNIGDNFEQELTRYFGVDEPCKNVPLDQYILMGQTIQAEVIRYAFEKYRSEKYLCSGTLFWMYSDCYPTSGWCFVDYYYNKKPLYYYTKRAFAPVSIFFNGYNPNTLKEYRETYEQNGDTVTLTLTADRYVWLCHLPHDEGIFFDNNDFDLVPGEPVQVTVSGSAAKDYRFRCLTMNDCL